MTPRGVLLLLDACDPSPLSCIHLLCLLVMREGSRIVDCIAYYGVLLIALWFSLRDVHVLL
jgi:hypothetical protein